AGQRDGDRERHQQDEHGRPEFVPGRLQPAGFGFHGRARRRDDWSGGHLDVLPHSSKLPSQFEADSMSRHASAFTPTRSVSSEYIRAMPNTKSSFVTIAVGPTSTVRSMPAARWTSCRI